MRIKNNNVVLLLGLIAGSILGLLLKEEATVLRPFGQLFINMIFVIIVPMIFCNIVISIAKLSGAKSLLYIFLPMIAIIVLTSFITSSFSYIGSRFVQFSSGIDIHQYFTESSVGDSGSFNVLEGYVNLISVSDFKEIFSKNNLIALLVFAIIFGFALRSSKEKGSKLLEIIDSANNVINHFLSIIMFYAPIGIACYFAALIGTYGELMLYGFAKFLITYIAICAVIFFVPNTLYVFLAGGKTGVKNWYKHIWIPELMALTTCSSAACMPICFEYSEKLGVDPITSNLVIPVGTNFHKDGAIVGSVMKIVFISQILSIDINPIVAILVGILSALLIIAVPTGASSMSEMFILSFLGFPLELLPVLIIITTIIDPVSTVVSVGGNMSSTLLIDKVAKKIPLMMRKNDE